MLTPRQSFVQWLSPVGLLRMAYLEWGDSQNPHVIICAHGLTRNAWDFSVLAQTLAKSYRVIAPDFPGRGHSDWLPDPSMYAIPMYVSACIPLLARTHATTIDWIGTSMGGLIGICLAGLKNQPLGKLILNDVGPHLEIAALKRLGSYVGERIRFNSMTEAVDYTRRVSAPFGEHTDAEWLLLTEHTVVPDAGGFKPHYDPKIGAAFQCVTEEMVAQAEAAMWPTYDQIAIPTLLLRGEHSDLLSRETAQLMTQRGPKAHWIDIPRVGHAPTLMHADQIERVTEFLRR